MGMPERFLWYLTVCYPDNVSGKRDRCVLKLFGWIDCADIFVNGERKDRIIGTPAYGMLDLKEGINEIAIEIPLTPVWSVGDNWSSLTMLHQIGMTKPPVIGF